MLGPFATASHLTPIHQMSLAVLSRAACASMSTTTTTTTTTTRDRGDRYGPMEWAQLSTFDSAMVTDSPVYFNRFSHLCIPTSQFATERKSSQHRSLRQLQVYSPTTIITGLRQSVSANCAHYRPTRLYITTHISAAVQNVLDDA